MTNNLARLSSLLSTVLVATAVVGCGDGSELTAGDEAAPGQVGAPLPDPEGLERVEQPLWNTCQGADIRVLNSRSDTITVRSIDYFNFTEGRWQSEGLVNKVVTPGDMQFWWEDLERADGDVITSFNVIFDHPGHNGHVQHINTPDQACATGRVYLLEIR
jgi:hypothetical protein